MKNAFVNTVHIINHAQRCIDIKNYVEAKEFLDMAIEEDNDFSYAALYKEAIVMVEGGQNRYANFGAIKNRFNRCKEIIEKHHIVSIQKQIIMSRHTQQTNQIEQSQDMKKLKARMAVMLTIIDNIDDNLKLIDKGNTDRHYLQNNNSSTISQMMNNQNQVFIDEAKSEARHGIGDLSYLKLWKETPPKKKGFFRRLGDGILGVGKCVLGFIGAVFSFGQWKSAVRLMKSGAQEIKEAITGRGLTHHEVVARSSTKSTDLVIADIATAVKNFGENIDLQNDVAQVLNSRGSIEEIKQRLNNNTCNNS